MLILMWQAVDMYDYHIKSSGLKVNKNIFSVSLYLVMKKNFVRVSKNNKDAMLKQFKQVNDMLQAIITSSATRYVFFSMLLEQKRALSTSVSSSSENGNYADIPCLRVQQIYSAHRGVQACKFQTIVEAIALQLNM